VRVQSIMLLILFFILVRVYILCICTRDSSLLKLPLPSINNMIYLVFCVSQHAHQFVILSSLLFPAPLVLCLLFHDLLPPQEFFVLLLSSHLLLVPSLSFLIFPLLSCLDLAPFLPFHLELLLNAASFHLQVSKSTLSPCSFSVLFFLSLPPKPLLFLTVLNLLS